MIICTARSPNGYGTGAQMFFNIMRSFLAALCLTFFFFQVIKGFRRKTWKNVGETRKLVCLSGNEKSSGSSDWSLEEVAAA